MAAPTTEPLTTVDENEQPKTKERLEELAKAASIHYSTKNFSAAADTYADAVELQAELNGEMAPENAELLFYAARALYKVAVAKSDVLGNKVTSEDKKKSKAKKAAKAEKGESSVSNGAKPDSKEESVESKPYFQLTGDENWEDSEDDDEDAEGAEGEEEEEDDFLNAYETFELARVLYSRQLETRQAREGATKGKEEATLTPQARAIQEKIADCHGFLVEISLENERFHDAVHDARASLELQQELNPFDHENVTEAHYSLSLALEFASVSHVREGQTDREGEQASSEQADPNADGNTIDQALRSEAAEQTQLAIDSLTARLAREEAALTLSTLTPEQTKEKRAIVEDKKSMLEDLRTRLADLKSDPQKQDFDSLDPDVMQGLLGGLLGMDKDAQKKKIAEATKGANDVSGMVKKKAKPAPAPAAPEGKGKRKLEVEDGGDGKRAKTEEPAL